MNAQKTKTPRKPKTAEQKARDAARHREKHAEKKAAKSAGTADPLEIPKGLDQRVKDKDGNPLPVEGQIAESNRRLKKIGGRVSPKTPVPQMPKGRAAKKAIGQAVKTSDRKRNGSKSEQMVELLKRKGGVTAAELMKKAGWKAHSVRGFIAGHVKKKLGLSVVATKTDDGMSYRIG